MKKKIIFSILTIMMLLILVACSASEEEYREYANEYITFNYPADWNIRTNQYDNNESILIEKNSNDNSQFAFGISLEVMGDVKNEDEINKKIEDSFKDLMKGIEESESGQVISYEETTIDGEWAKRLQREVKHPDIQIEQIYLILKQEMSSYKEVTTYLEQYKDAKAFIDEIKDNPDKLEELDTILEQLDDKSVVEKSLVNSTINKARNSLNEKNNFVLKGFDLGSYKENVRLNILFNSNDKEYNDLIQIIEKILDSIKFNI